MTHNFNTHFEAVCASVFNELSKDEHTAISYSAEQSFFTRFNNAKIRQQGYVNQASVDIKLWKGNKSHAIHLGLSGDIAKDDLTIAKAIGEARVTIALLPDDPYQAIPTGNEKSHSVYRGSLIPEDKITDKIFTPVQGLDFTGLFSQGLMCRGAANSNGAKHWFESDTFIVDYSAWLKNGRAVKSSYAGRDWSDAEYASRIKATKNTLDSLSAAEKVLSPGKYRAFITADALNEVITFFSWNGFGELGIREGESAYIAMREGRESMSPLMTFSQDFSLGLEPRFNSNGELAPEKLTVVEAGKLKNTIISSRTAKQYNLEANGADDDESVHSVAIEGGKLNEADALAALGTGVYVSDFHYLNWSDVQAARVTGMTRFSCMWVENGKVVAPIKDMRWDESLYNMLGSNLEAITKERHLIVETSTYEQRQTGGCLIPGILVKDLSFTL